MNQADMNEAFLTYESKVNQVMKLLDDISSANKSDSETARKGSVDLTGHINEDSFIVCMSEKSPPRTKSITNIVEPEAELDEMYKFTFMQQMEEDMAERVKVREGCERIAQNLRSLGNDAFRKAAYDRAVHLYSKAIDHIKDSPILYNNRSLAYIKLKSYKRAIMDTDYVLNKLDEKNLRSWLYRAVAYKRLNDEKNYDTSVKFARKNNSKEGDFIDEFLEKLRTDY